ncbi:MAG: hypothetical protein RIC55_24110 [Pirellulaceae bacterium]
MPTPLRITLLCAFAAAGVGLAVSVVVQTDPRTLDADDPLHALLRGVAKAAPSPFQSPREAAAETEAEEGSMQNVGGPAAPRHAPLHGPVAQQMSQLTQTLARVEQANKQSQLERLERTLDRVAAAADRNEQMLAQAPPPTIAQVAPVVPPVDGGGSESLPPPDQLQIEKNAGDDSLIVNVKNSDLRDVLDLLSEQTEINILASPNVRGTVTASLSRVSVEEAVDAMLQLTGFQSRREGNFLYVGTPADLTAMDQLRDKVATRVYRPNYVAAADLQVLVTPLLTESIGSVTVSTAAQVDIPSDTTTSGGDSFAQSEVLLVRDYEAVLRQIDAIVVDVDVPPRQVMIEAMIVSVSLDDQTRLGINLETLLNKQYVRPVIGTPLMNLANMDVSEGGLNIGFLDASLSAFIEALDSIGDTEVIASPRLLCVNKQRAEILIGEQKGYLNSTSTETATTQTVEFLDVGTQLRIRPFISSDGMIRMEIHPELSTGDVQLIGQFALPEKAVTQVTSNVMCRDGATIVVGGLIRDDISRTRNQIPILGNLPVIGAAFRRKIDTVEREEIIVVITPHIIHDPLTHNDGKPPLAEIRHRESHVFVDRMTPVARKYYSNRYLRLAKSAWLAGNGNAALSYIDMALHFTPRRHEALVLRDEILTGVVGAVGYNEAVVIEPYEDDAILENGMLNPPATGSGQDGDALPLPPRTPAPTTPPVKQEAPRGGPKAEPASFSAPSSRRNADNAASGAPRMVPPDVAAPMPIRTTGLLRNIGPPPIPSDSR